MIVTTAPGTTIPAASAFGGRQFQPRYRLPLGSTEIPYAQRMIPECPQPAAEKVRSSSTEVIPYSASSRCCRQIAYRAGSAAISGGGDTAVLGGVATGVSWMRPSGQSHGVDADVTAAPAAVPHPERAATRRGAATKTAATGPRMAAPAKHVPDPGVPPPDATGNTSRASAPSTDFFPGGRRFSGCSRRRRHGGVRSFVEIGRDPRGPWAGWRARPLLDLRP